MMADMIAQIGIKNLLARLTAARAAFLDAAISSRAVPGDAMALTAAERLIVQALVINDLTPFAGASIDAAISSRAIPGDAMALTAAERLIVQALVINDLTPFAGARIDATISSRAAPGAAMDLLAATVTAIRQSVCAGGDPAGSVGKLLNDYLNAAITSRAATGEATAALAAVAYTRQAGVSQIKPTTIDLNQAAATYDLFTATTQDVVVEKLVIRMSGGAIGGAFTYLTIQTDDATPIVLINATDGAVGNLTNEAQLAWTGAILLDAGTGAKIRLTIAVAQGGAARVCDVVAECRAVVTGGYLA